MLANNQIGDDGAAAIAEGLRCVKHLDLNVFMHFLFIACHSCAVMEIRTLEVVRIFGCSSSRYWLFLSETSVDLCVGVCVWQRQHGIEESGSDVQPCGRRGCGGVGGSIARTSAPPSLTPRGRWMEERMDGWMGGWMDGTDGWMDGWVDGWMDGGIDGKMYQWLWAWREVVTVAIFVGCHAERL